MVIAYAAYHPCNRSQNFFEWVWALFGRDPERGAAFARRSVRAFEYKGFGPGFVLVDIPYVAMLGYYHLTFPEGSTYYSEAAIGDWLGIASACSGRHFLRTLLHSSCSGP